MLLEAKLEPRSSNWQSLDVWRKFLKKLKVMSFNSNFYSVPWPQAPPTGCIFPELRKPRLFLFFFFFLVRKSFSSSLDGTRCPRVGWYLRVVSPSLKRREGSNRGEICKGWTGRREGMLRWECKVNKINYWKTKPSALLCIFGFFLKISDSVTSYSSLYPWMIAFKLSKLHTYLEKRFPLVDSNVAWIETEKQKQVRKENWKNTCCFSIHKIAPLFSSVVQSLGSQYHQT